MKFPQLSLVSKRKRFGRGKHTLDLGKLQKAMTLKGQGFSTLRVAKMTGLNRGTVAGHWRRHQPLPNLLDDLGKEALHHDPELRRQAGAARVMGQQGPTNHTAKPQAPAAPPAAQPAPAQWEQRWVREVVEFTF